MDRRDQIDIDPRFGLLPEPEGRATRFATSAAINAVLFGIFLLLAIAAVKKVAEPPMVSTTLVLPDQTPPPPPPKPKPLPKVKITPPPPVPQPKIEVPPPPKPVIVRVEQPKPVVAPPAPPKLERVAPPPPKVGLFTSAAPTKVANNNKPPTVKTGGFGDPQGVAPNPNATKAANIAAVGGFDMPKGSGVGAGAAGRGSVKGVAFGTGTVGGQPGGTGHGTVNIAGFSNGVAGGVPGGTGTGRGGVKSGGFGSTVGGPTGPAHVANEEPQSTNPVVLWKPDPKQYYSADAKAAKVEGQVKLRIRVDASGHAEVLSVISGLGHGLDQAAEQMVRMTRFKPALANGQPVDKEVNYVVSFQLA